MANDAEQFFLGLNAQLHSVLQEILSVLKDIRKDVGRIEDMEETLYGISANISTIEHDLGEIKSGGSEISKEISSLQGSVIDITSTSALDEIQRILDRIEGHVQSIDSSS